MASRRAHLSFSLFRNRLEDVIDEAPATYEGQSTVDGRPVIQRVNAAHGYYQGIEAAAGVQALRLTWSAAVTGMRGDITGLDGVKYPARRIPPIFGTAGMRYEPVTARGWAEFLVQWATRQDRLHPSDEQDLRICETSPHSGVLCSPCAGTAGWWTLNLRGGWRLGRQLRLQVTLANLADRRYRLHASGIDEPGFDARSMLIAELGR